jgi:ADP-ribose pyrophosphatase
MKFELIRSEQVYKGRAFDVHRDQVRTPDSQVVTLDVVSHVGAVTILPIDQDGQVWFVRQYRHPAGQILLELPAGTLEPGEDPETCARRELREEIGMGADQIEKLGEFFLAPGYSTEYMHIFLAQGLSPDPLPGDEDEFLSPVVFPVSQIKQIVRTGEIKDAKTLAALSLAADRIWD